MARANEVAEAIGETISVVFIESICEDNDVLEANMLAKVRASPDFTGMDEAAALADLKSRVANYEAVYEPVSDEEGAYIKLYDISAKVSARHVFGRMSQRVLPYMMSLPIGLRPVFLATYRRAIRHAYRRALQRMAMPRPQREASLPRTYRAGCEPTCLVRRCVCFPPHSGAQCRPPR